MKVTFLGTGTSQGVPVITCECTVCKSLDFRDKRLRSSVLIQSDEAHFVIDTGPDFRTQMLREKVARLDAIVFTHEHKDHTAGLDDVRAFNFKQKKDMPVFARKKVIEQLKMEFGYAFSPIKYPGVPQIAIHEIDNVPFKINDCTVTPIEVMHHKLPVFGFRIGDFTYITDANHISDVEMEKIRGSKVLVLNALQKEDHISHFTLEEAIGIAAELNVEKTYLTHISHRLGKHAAVEENLPDGVLLAYDGLQITV